MHVPLRRRQIRVAGQFLNRPSGRAAHGEMGTERVPESMHAASIEPRTTRRSADVVLHNLLRQRRRESSRQTEHTPPNMRAAETTIARTPGTPRRRFQRQRQ
jgi:hypothetical protein